MFKVSHYAIIAFLALSTALMVLKLGESDEWADLVNEAATLTHATAEEVWDGMAKALRDYLESLDGLTAFMPNDVHVEWLRGDAE